MIIFFTCLRHICYPEIVKIFPLCFHTASSFIFRFIIHLELCKKWDTGQDFFTILISNWFSTINLTRSDFPYRTSVSSVINQGLNICRSVFGLSIVFHQSFVNIPQIPHCLNSFKIHLDIWLYISSNVVLLSDCFGNSWSFAFPNYRIGLSISTDIPPGILVGFVFIYRPNREELISYK